MAITTYATLRTAVRQWLKREATADISDSQINEFIEMAEDRIARSVRIREMETTADLSLTADTQTVALPTRFLATRRIYLDGSPTIPLTFLPPPAFFAKFLSSDTAQPKAFTYEADNIVFGPTPDTTYTGKHLYYEKLTPFSADGDSNSLLTNHRGIYLYATLLEAVVYMDDDSRSLTWASLFDDLVEQIHKMDVRDRFPSGHATVASVGVTVA